MIIPWSDYQEYLAYICFKRAMGRKFDTFEEYHAKRQKEQIR
jgi:hypothetical protein